MDLVVPHGEVRVMENCGRDGSSADKRECFPPLQKQPSCERIEAFIVGLDFNVDKIQKFGDKADTENQ